MSLPRRQRFCIKTRLIGPLNQNVRAAVSVNLHAFGKQATGRKIKLALFTTQQLIVNQYSAVDNENSCYGIRVSSALLETHKLAAFLQQELTDAAYIVLFILFHFISF